MGLERYVGNQNKLTSVAELFWERLWPELQKELSQADKAVVLGTAPFKTEKGTVRNRAPILVEGRSLQQDKMFLTPWEKGFTGGEQVCIWTFRGIRFAVLICFDIEMPELSATLRGRGIQALLVPSATESVLGVERVGRCASARAVELGCYVGVSHLVGQTESELVDHNVGRLAWFTPSQSAFQESPREWIGEIQTHGFHQQRCLLDTLRLQIMTGNKEETNPALVSRREAGVMPTVVGS
jgi:predicted amidohydrolase